MHKRIDQIVHLSKANSPQNKPILLFWWSTRRLIRNGQKRRHSISISHVLIQVFIVVLIESIVSMFECFTLFPSLSPEEMSQLLRNKKN